MNFLHVRDVVQFIYVGADMRGLFPAFVSRIYFLRLNLCCKSKVNDVVM